MSLQLNIKQFISLLNQGKDTIDLLFGQKDSVDKDEILSITRPEIFDKFLVHKVINENEHNISLDDRLVTFFEEFLEIGEVNTGTINDSIRTLTENISYYRQENKIKYLREIKKVLRKINFTTNREVIKLDKIIDDTYKNEESYRTKLQKLKNYRVKRDDILTLIQETEQILEREKSFFISTPDHEIRLIEHSLKVAMIENKDFLNEIQAQIIDYINKIQIKPDVFKKIQQIKELKDNAELKYKTNFVELVKNENALVFQPRAVFRSRPALDWLATDDGRAVLARIAKRLQFVDVYAKNMADEIISGFDENRQITYARVNVRTFLDKFMATRQDLFSFILNFVFSDELGEMNIERRLTLFVEISMDFERMLTFKDDFGVYTFKNSDGKKTKVGYAMVFANKKYKEIE